MQRISSTLLKLIGFGIFYQNKHFAVILNEYRSITFSQRWFLCNDLFRFFCVWDACNANYLKNCACSKLRIFENSNNITICHMFKLLLYSNYVLRARAFTANAHILILIHSHTPAEFSSRISFSHSQQKYAAICLYTFKSLEKKTNDSHSFEWMVCCWCRRCSRRRRRSYSLFSGHIIIYYNVYECLLYWPRGSHLMGVCVCVHAFR